MFRAPIFHHFNVVEVSKLMFIAWKCGEICSPLKGFLNLGIENWHTSFYDEAIHFCEITIDTWRKKAVETSCLSFLF